LIARVALPIGNSEAISVLLLPSVTKPRRDKSLTDALGGFLGVRNIYTVNAGRTALGLALAALGLKKGDTVLVPAYTCAAVVEAVILQGLTPRLVDVDPKSFNMAPDAIRAALGPSVKAIIPIHLFGRPCEMDQVMEIADSNGLYVVEDCAQSLGSRYNGRMTGTFGDASVFSFGIGKSMTTGEGGALAVNNQEFVDRVSLLHDILPVPGIAWRIHVARTILAAKTLPHELVYSMLSTLAEHETGRADMLLFAKCVALAQDPLGKSSSSYEPMKMPSYCARIGLGQLSIVESLNAKRVANAIYLLGRLSAFGTLLGLPEFPRKGTYNTFTRFPILPLRVARDTVVRRMRDSGVDAEIPYQHLRLLLESGLTAQAVCVNARSLSERLMTIPNHPLLDQSDLERVCNALVETVGQS